MRRHVGQNNIRCFSSKEFSRCPLLRRGLLHPVERGAKQRYAAELTVSKRENVPGKTHDVTSNEHQHSISVRCCSCTKGQVRRKILLLWKRPIRLAQARTVTAVMVRVGFWQCIDDVTWSLQR